MNKISLLSARLHALYGYSILGPVGPRGPEIVRRISIGVQRGLDEEA